MYHRNYTTYLQKELEFLKILVARFHEQEKINGLELDIALQKTQEIYEQLLRIKSMPAPLGEPMPQPVHTAPRPEPKPVVIETESSAPVDVPMPGKVVAAKEEKVVAAPEGKVVAAKEEKISKEETTPPACEETKQPDVEPAKGGILAEKIGPTGFHPINETLAQQKPGTDLSSKLQTAPLSSIVSGIGINDKFLYMRELFKGDSALYSNTIRHLDTAESLGDAMDFIHRHFDWDKKNDTVQKFINLVQRRHGN